MASTMDTLVAAIRTQMADSSIDFRTGVKALSEHGKAPRIVFVRTGGNLEEPNPPGTIAYPYQGKTYSFKRIYDDVATIQAHVWAADEEKWERLRQRLLSATRTLFRKASVPGAYSVDTEGERAGHVHGDAVSGWQLFSWRLTVAETTVKVRTTDLSETGPMVPVRALLTVLYQTHDCTIDYDL